MDLVGPDPYFQASSNKYAPLQDIADSATDHEDLAPTEKQAVPVQLQVEDKVDFVRTLPPEIVSTIFVYACQPTPDPFTTPSGTSLSESSRANPRWKRRFFPLWLGRVCRSWRSVAWNSLELWGTIVLRIAASQDEVDQQTDLLREWLDRAHEYPLDIYVEEDTVANWRRAISRARCRNALGEEAYGVDASDVPDANLLLALLFSCARQWRTIDFHLPQKRYEFISFLAAEEHPADSDRRKASNSTSSRPRIHSVRMKSKRPAFPSLLGHLQTASLHDCEGITRSELPMNLLLPQACSLTELSFSRMVMKPDLLHAYPTTMRITRLTLSYALHIVPRLLLSQFPALQELTLARYTIVGKLEPNAASNPITHENLRVLHVYAETEFVFNMFIHQLVLPVLASLHVCVPGKFSHANFLLTFLRRSESSGCALAHLTLEPSISSAGVTTDDLVGFLSSKTISTSLRELRILDHDTLSPDRMKTLRHGRDKNHGLGAGFFERFHPHAYPYFLPNLEKFEYRGLIATGEIDFLEVFILRSRMRELPKELECGMSLNRMAVLRKVSIRADHVSGIPMSIAEYHDVKYVWEVIRMVEEGVFSLLDRDGAPWM